MSSEGVKELMPEMDIFCHLLVLLYLNDSKQVAKGLELSLETIAVLQGYNRRSLDSLGGRVCFYYARFHELSGKTGEIRGYIFGLNK